MVKKRYQIVLKIGFFFSYSGTPALTKVNLTPGQSSVVTGSVFSAGTFLVTGSATIGGTTYTANAGVKTIAASDITVSMTLA